MKLLAIVASFIAALPALGDTGDDTLKYFLSKSDLVVMGKITSEPIGINDEAGVPNYVCDFRVQDVLKGDGKLKDQAIRVNITRFEMDPKDKHPLIKKDGECILFLKHEAPNVPTWGTADFWFGVQHPSPWMARSLKRLVAEESIQAKTAPTMVGPHDAIDGLVARLEATPGHLWQNGRYPVIHLPEDASPEKVVAEVFKMTGFDKGQVKDFKILKTRSVQIDGGSYTAALVQTDLGPKTVLFTAGGAWSRVYDADEPEKNDLPLSKGAQAVLDGLNLKAADAFWQSSIDWIERPETRPPNTVDSGEVVAFLADSKKRLKNMGVRVAWNPAAKRYEVMAEAKDVDLGRVEMVDGSPSTFDLGGGRSCTITPTIGFSAVNAYELVLQDGAEKVSAPRKTAVVGQPVHISVGQIAVTFVPHVKPKP